MSDDPKVEIPEEEKDCHICDCEICKTVEKFSDEDEELEDDAPLELGAVSEDLLDIEQFAKGCADGSYYAGFVSTLAQTGLSQNAILELIKTHVVIREELQIAEINERIANKDFVKNKKSVL
jgi:hypothetical protein